MAAALEKGRTVTIRPDATEAEVEALLLGLEPDTRGPLVRFKLCMVPEKLRQQAAERICRRLGDEGGWEALQLAIEVRRRAMFPSDQTYRVSREAWEKVMSA
jgi:hypothetical protein